jgi:phospholipid/cholesterol/gamma-HCH transport system ATP-binding protein
MRESSSRASRADSPEAAVVLSDVHKAFGSKVVLRGVDMEIPRGKSTVIIGGSGTGKSVLLKHIIGLLTPDRGTVTVDGVAINELGNREITRFPLVRQREMSKREISERVRECLREVGLEDAVDKMPSQLSGGMRRRVGFARAVANRPEILLFDEPTTGLDPITKGTIDDLIVELKERLGSTTVTITHDMESVFRIADWVGMLHEGRIVAWAPPDGLRAIDEPNLRAFIARGHPHESRTG